MSEPSAPEPTPLSRLDVASLLPHGPEFTFVSELLQHEPGALGSAKHWSHDDQILKSHFPRGPRVVPGVLLCEQAAQTALLLAMLDQFVPPGETLLLASMRCEFPASAIAPCTVLAWVRTEAVILDRFGFQARCMVGHEEVARIRGIATRVPER